MGFRGGGSIESPPSISWYSSTPAEIGLNRPLFVCFEIVLCIFRFELVFYLFEFLRVVFYLFGGRSMFVSFWGCPVFVLFGGCSLFFGLEFVLYLFGGRPVTVQVHFMYCANFNWPEQAYYQLKYAIFFTPCSIVYTYSTRPISKQQYPGNI